MKKILLTTALLACQYAYSQSNIYPTPQSVKLNNSHNIILSNGVKLYGAESADQYAVEQLKTLISTDKKGTKLYIGEQNDRTMKKFAKAVELPQKSGAYYIKTSPKEIIIMGYDEAGTFYAIQTLKQMISQGSLIEAEIIDYPDIAFRGVVEGYYGKPWSHRDRLSQFKFYGENKLNTYIYGPKDDPYHSSLVNNDTAQGKDVVKKGWRVPYPEEDAKKIRELVDVAKQNKVNFVWAIHPGQDIQWNEEDFQNLINKFEDMYQLGVRSYAVFFDDISGEGTNPKKQAELLNRINKEFIKAKGDVTPLIMCPTEYNKSWSNPKEDGYLPILGKELDPSIQIMWTGDRVCDDITMSTLEWVNVRIKRPTFIWWNFPVTDYVRNRLAQGPSYGLDVNATSNDMSGFTSNPMENAEATKLALFGVADYTWNTANYKYMKAWEEGIKRIMPEASDAYRTFAIHSASFGENWHRFHRDESWETDIIDPLNYSVADFDKLMSEFEKVEAAPHTILNSGANEYLLAEMKPWLKEFEKLGKRGVNALKMVDTYNKKGNLEKIWNFYLKAEMNGAQKENYKAKISGSYKLQPFIDSAILVIGDKLYQDMSGDKSIQLSKVETISELYSSIDQIKGGVVNKNDESYSLNPVQEVINAAPNSYIGIKLPYIMEIPKVAIDLTTPLTIEVSDDGHTWNRATFPTTGRYVRYINSSDESKEIRLKRFEIFVSKKGTDSNAAHDRDFSTGYKVIEPITLAVPSGSKRVYVLAEDGNQILINGNISTEFGVLDLNNSIKSVTIDVNGVIREVIFEK